MTKVEGGDILYAEEELGYVEVTWSGGVRGG